VRRGSLPFQRRSTKADDADPHGSIGNPDKRRRPCAGEDLGPLRLTPMGVRPGGKFGLCRKFGLSFQETPSFHLQLMSPSTTACLAPVAEGRFDGLLRHV